MQKFWFASRALWQLEREEFDQQRHAAFKQRSFAVPQSIHEDHTRARHALSEPRITNVVGILVRHAVDKTLTALWSHRRNKKFMSRIISGNGGRTVAQ